MTHIGHDPSLSRTESISVMDWPFGRFWWTPLKSTSTLVAVCCSVLQCVAGIYQGGLLWVLCHFTGFARLVWGRSKCSHSFLIQSYWCIFYFYFRRLCTKVWNSLMHRCFHPGSPALMHVGTHRHTLSYTRARARARARLHTDTRTYTHTYTHTHELALTRTRTRLHTHPPIHKPIFSLSLSHAYTHARTRTRTHTHIDTRLHTHTHTHTHNIHTTAHTRTQPLCTCVRWCVCADIHNHPHPPMYPHPDIQFYSNVPLITGCPSVTCHFPRAMTSEMV